MLERAPDSFLFTPGSFLFTSGVRPLTFVCPRTFVPVSGFACGWVCSCPGRVFTPEHIVAIALETGRAKDKARVLQFIEANAVDLGRVREILTRHGLSGNWQQFEQQFLE
jgi:hypothetical protein